MKCWFPSKCDEPKGVCCNFCDNKKCDIRCKDDHKTCRYFDSDTTFTIEQGKENHIIWPNKVKPIIIESKEEKTNKPKPKVEKAEVVKVEALKKNISGKALYRVINRKQKLKLYRLENKFIQLKFDKKAPEGFEEYTSTKVRAENKAESLNSKLSRKYWAVEEITNEV